MERIYAHAVRHASHALRRSHVSQRWRWSNIDLVYCSLASTEGWTFTVQCTKAKSTLDGSPAATSAHRKAAMIICLEHLMSDLCFLIINILRDTLTKRYFCSPLLFLPSFPRHLGCSISSPESCCVHAMLSCVQWQQSRTKCCTLCNLLIVRRHF